MHKILSCFTINLFKYFFCQHRVNCVVDSAVGLVKTAKLAIWIIKTHNFCTCVTYLTQEREEGGGAGVLRISNDGDGRMGAKIKTRKISWGFQQNPKKSHGGSPKISRKDKWYNTIKTLEIELRGRGKARGHYPRGITTNLPIVDTQKHPY